MQNTLKNELALQLQSAGTGGADVAALGVESHNEPNGIFSSCFICLDSFETCGLIPKQRVTSRDVILLSEGLGDW